MVRSQPEQGSALPSEFAIIEREVSHGALFDLKYGSREAVHLAPRLSGLGYT
jgi:hypothetical protein